MSDRCRQDTDLKFLRSSGVLINALKRDLAKAVVHTFEIV
jgi:hypothetical protein